MKKGLSILLVAAALFGFYGGATNLNDVLACKDYWEKAGEESTANMNKLEDGLNQLKDNEQAYLDGQDQLAEGEKTLADGEKTLADGEAQYAQGLADYAAAPGKLADARKQIAAGEAKLADGQESIDGLTQLINGIRQIRGGYNDSWRPGYEELKKGRDMIYKGSNGSKSDLEALAAFLDKSKQAAYVAAVNDVAGDDEKQAADDYKDFIESTNTMADDLPEIQESVKAKSEGAAQLLAALKNAVSGDLPNLTFAGTVDNQKDNLIAFAELITNEADKKAYVGAVNTVSENYQEIVSETIPKNVEATIKGKITEGVTAQMKSAGVQQQIQALVASGMTVKDATATVQEKVTESVTAAVMGQKDAITEGVKQAVDAGAQEKLAPAKTGIIGAMTQISETLAAVNEKVNGDDSKINNELLPGLQKFNKSATSSAVNQLSGGQAGVAGGVATVAGAVLGNSTLKAGVQKNFGSSAIALLNAYKNANGPLSTGAVDFAAFEAQMDSNPGINAFLKKAQDLLTKTRADGIKQLNAGKKKLAAGKAEYAQGLKDYAAAPGKLADAEKQLEDGRKQLADGRQALADGKAKLAEYEDGEQQVRDGLKTLTDTEADLDLKSIADRLSGDVDFDNGDSHLELEEGLAAVDIGRGYQAEDGVLITKEITARAVGTGALLGAGVLAVLAAILSFLKKNKGAGVLAILAAAAGAFGAFYGTQAGTYFSSIAGSTVGATGWVAAGILGVVALVHSIAHFTAKKDA